MTEHPKRQLSARQSPSLLVVAFIRLSSRMHLAAHNTIHVYADGAKHLNNPIRFASKPMQPDWRLPKLGEHNGGAMRFAGATRERRGNL